MKSFFDVTFCYFPITFRPPPGDPYGITPDQLKEKLLFVLRIVSAWETDLIFRGNRGCLSATPAFGRLGIDLFLEKLTAGSPVTKVRLSRYDTSFFLIAHFLSFTTLG